MQVLLASPRFHGYWQSFTSALEDLGHTVAVLLYDDFSGAEIFAADKVAARLPPRLAGSMRSLTVKQRITRRAVDFVTSTSIDAALVIKGDLLEHEFWDALERRHIPSVLYLYDELHGMQHTAETLHRPKCVATYSMGDRDRLVAEGYPAAFVPQFFDPKLAFEPTMEDAVVFVGARRPHRESLLVDLHRRGIPVAAYGQSWSPRLVDRVRARQLKRPAVPGRPALTLAASYGVAAGAAAAINIHAEFDGVNPRTFEICGAGGLQLSDRPDVDRFYDIGTELLVYGSTAELEELTLRAIRDRSWGQSIREAGRKRTIAEHTCLHRVRDLAAHW